MKNENSPKTSKAPKGPSIADILKGVSSRPEILTQAVFKKMIAEAKRLQKKYGLDAIVIYAGKQEPGNEDSAQCFKVCAGPSMSCEGLISRRGN